MSFIQTTLLTVLNTSVNCSLLPDTIHYVNYRGYHRQINYVGIF